MTSTRRRPLAAGLSAAFGLLAVGATGPGQEMLEEYNRLLNIMIFVAAGLAAFSLVWAAFTAMWDQNPSTTSRAKSAAIGALSGLLLTLLSKGIVVLLVGNTTVLLPTR